ncbi:hypothetical protein BBP40_012536 [Aspergillus hancockii]|nr:hypothetical protein BBP40_012536 [Aspergillus hancockii]
MVRPVEVHPQKPPKATPTAPVKKLVVGKRYEVYKRLGSGSQGAVYKAVDRQTGDKVAVKVVHNSRTDEIRCQQDEVEAYDSLYGFGGIPKLYWAGEERDYHCMRLMELHERKWLHQDVKPANILLGVGEKSHIVYLADFGLAQKYRPPRGDDHLREPSMVGSEPYASVNAHYSRRQTYTDDLESLGYMLVEFCSGYLPWDRVAAKTKEERRASVALMKHNITIKELCKGLPREFEKYFEHVHTTKHGVLPDYEYLLENFRRLFFREGFKDNRVYDWTHNALEKPERERKENLKRELELEKEELRKEISNNARPVRMIPRAHTAKPASHDRGPQSKEDTQTDFAALNVLGNIPAPTTAIDACLDNGFHLDNGLKLTNGDGLLLVGGEAFSWKPWEARDGDQSTMVNIKGQFEVDEQVWGLLGLVWPRPDLLIIGMGASVFPLSPETRRHINSLGVRVEVLDTRNAAAQFNLLATERGVSEIAAAMIPIGWKGR